MKKTLAVSAILLALVLSPGGSGTAADTAAAPSRVEYFDCLQQFAAFPVPRVLLNPLIPPEFTPTTFSVLPGTAVGSVPVYVQRCARAVTDAGAVFEHPMQAWLAIWVAPPAAWRLGPGAAHYWVVDRVASDAALVDLYTAWGLAGGEVGAIAMERMGNDDAWVDTASVEASGLGFEMVNANVGPGAPWAGLQARFFGHGADGAIHAADHREEGGFISQIQPSVARPVHDAVPLLPLGAGLGRTFTGAPGARTWTFTEVALPTLP